MPVPVTESGLAAVLQLFKSGQTGSAAEACARILESSPDDVQALMLMSAIRHRQEREQEALTCLQRVVPLLGDDTNGLLKVVTGMQRIGALDEAAAVLDTMDFDRADVCATLGHNDWLRGEYQTALKQFQMVARGWPQFPESHVSYVRGLVRFGWRDRAAKALDDGLARFPQHEELNRLKSLYLLDDQDPEAALEQAGRVPPASSGPFTSLLRHALRTIGGQDETGPGHDLLRDSRPAAMWESFNWVRERAPGARWFGTATELLRWATEQAPENGAVIECGVFRGFSINLLAEWCGREVHGFDSFEGLPERWTGSDPAGSQSAHGQPPPARENVTLHAGWFEDTLPAYVRSLEDGIALIHADCALRSSSATVLDVLGPRLVEGGIIVFGDLFGYPGYEEHQFKAAEAFFEQDARCFELIGAVLLGRAAAFRVR